MPDNELRDHTARNYKPLTEVTRLAIVIKMTIIALHLVIIVIIIIIIIIY